MAKFPIIEAYLIVCHIFFFFRTNKKKKKKRVSSNSLFNKVWQKDILHVLHRKKTVLSFFFAPLSYFLLLLHTLLCWQMKLRKASTPLSSLVSPEKSDFPWASSHRVEQVIFFFHSKRLHHLLFQEMFNRAWKSSLGFSIYIHQEHIINHDYVIMAVSSKALVL